MTREEAENVARVDLGKSLEHLLADVHHEIESEGRAPWENVLHAQKRFASLQAKAAKSADRTANVLIFFTVVVAVLTAVLVVLTIALVRKGG